MERNERLYLEKKNKFLAYCLDIQFIDKSQIDTLSEIYDKLKSNDTPSPVEGEKEELRKRFNHFTCFEWGYEDAHLVNDKYMDEVFDFFYSEILSRQNANTILKGALHHQREKTEARASRIKALEERLEAADETIRIVGTLLKLLGDHPVIESHIEAYNKLKH